MKAQQELVYSFNLEPVGYGNTLPERRRDREDVKWTLRSAQHERSIFQVQEGEDATIKAVTEAEAQTAETAPMETAPEVPAETNSDSRSKLTAFWKAISQAMRMALRTSDSTSLSQLRFPITSN